MTSRQFTAGVITVVAVPLVLAVTWSSTALWVAVALFLIAWAWLVGWLAGQAKGRVDTLHVIDENRRRRDQHRAAFRPAKPSREIDPW